MLMVLGKDTLPLARRKVEGNRAVCKCFQRCQRQLGPTSKIVPARRLVWATLVDLVKIAVAALAITKATSAVEPLPGKFRPAVSPLLYQRIAKTEPVLSNN